MTTFFAELKRRNVIRVAAAYIVVAWLLLQIGDVLFEALQLENSALTILLAFLIIGFIPVVIFAWVYELTPDGIKRESEIDKSDSITQHTGRKLNIITLTTVVILIALIFWDRNFAPVPRVEPIPESEDITITPSIAVLPFQDMSVEGDQGYFGDGIAEELLNVLAKTEGLRVAARTSSFTFKGNEKDIREIGQTLDVKTVLEGSIRKDKDNIRVTAQLINAENGYHIWSESYDRKLDNIFQVQDEIAIAIVDALKLTLDIESTKHQDISSEAYDLYLRGREAARIIDKKNQLLAVEFFEKAIAIEPDFASAHAGLASSWIWLEDYGGFPSELSFKIVAKSARKALEIDSGNPEALMAMGLYFYNVEDDLVLSKTLFEYALKENPSLVPIYFHYSDILNFSNLEQEALTYRKKAIELDPLSTFYRSRLVYQLNMLKRPEEALEQADIIFQQNPDDTHGLEERGNIYATLGQYADAIQDYIQVHENRPGDPYSAAHIAIYYEYLGLRDKADYWLQQARFRGEDNRWELRARVIVNLLRQDWPALHKAADIQMKTDVDTAQGVKGFAYLQQGELEKARESFADMINIIELVPGKTVSDGNTIGLLGQVLLDKLTNSENVYKDSLQADVDSTASKRPYIYFPELHAKFINACLIMLNDRLNLEEKNIAVTEELSNAIDTGFRQKSLLDYIQCFDPIRETAEFQAVYEQLDNVISEETEKLAELGLLD